MSKSFPKTLKAVRTAERSGYDVAKALWVEVEKTEAGNAKQGEIKRASEYLTKNSAGDRYTNDWLSKLHVLGGWIYDSGHKLPMSPRMAIEARKQGLTADKSMVQWGDGQDEDGNDWTLRTWAAFLGHKWEDLAAEDAEEAVHDAEDKFGAEAVAEAVTEKADDELLEIVVEKGKAEAKKRQTKSSAGKTETELSAARVIADIDGHLQKAADQISKANDLLADAVTEGITFTPTEVSGLTELPEDLIDSRVTDYRKTLGMQRTEEVIA